MAIIASPNVFVNSFLDKIQKDTNNSLPRYNTLESVKKYQKQLKTKESDLYSDINDNRE